MNDPASSTAANAPTPTETIQYQYDPVTGNPTLVTDTNTGVVTITTNTYDPNTQSILSVATAQGSASSVIHYAYNAAGQHTETWTGSGSSDATSTTDTFYAYDELDRLRTVTVTRLNGAALVTPQVTTSLYDADGNLARTLLPNGTRTVYGYDDLDHLIWTSNIAPSVFGDVLLGGYDYNVDVSGRRDAATEQRLESDGTYSTSLYTWTYDNLDRLTTEQLAQFDPQSSTFNAQNYVANYVLDLVGNRLSKTTVGVYTEVISYTYDHGDGTTSNDRLMTETATLAGNAEYSTTYGYDANGSMTSLTRTGTGPQTGTYTYDLQNRLQSSTINNVATSYGYDGGGNRISEATGSAATYYLIDNNNPTGYSQTLQESATLGGTPTTTYTLGNRVLAQSASTGATLYLMPDGRGGTRLITDATGTIKARYDFDAFGTALNFSAATALTKYLYDGQQYDSGAGQYDLRARYYSTAIGRFTAADRYLAPPADFANANRYEYVGSNPVDLSDPLGLGPYTPGFGYAAEAAIQARYGQGHPKQIILYGVPTGLGRNPALKPDIFNVSGLEWMEIKPLSVYGIISGIAQRAAYIRNFAPIGYSANTTWVPATQPLVVLGQSIYVFNVGGILFYTDLSPMDLLVLPFLYSSSEGVSGAFSQRAFVQIEEIQARSLENTVATRAAQIGGLETAEVDTEIGIDALEEI